jgi:hypothetical protein
MFFQRLGTPDVCLSMLALGNFAVGQSNRLKQTASISDIPLTSRGRSGVDSYRSRCKRRSVHREQR